MTDDQREAHTLRPCFCGAIPEKLAISEPFGRVKWAYCTCDKCGEWAIEFRANYKTDLELYNLAVNAWNNAPRATDD